MKCIITESELKNIVNFILNEQGTIDPKVLKLRNIMKKAGVSVSEGKPSFMMNELNFLLNLTNTSDPQQRIEKINTRIKTKGNPELTQDEITLVNNYFQENNVTDINKAIKIVEKETEKRNKIALANQKKGTFSYGTGDRNINTNTCGPDRKCPKLDDVGGLTRFERSLREK